MSQQAELNKQKQLESIRQGRFTEKKPTEKELKKERYLEALSKNPPARIDEIAKFLGKTPDESTGGILAQYRKMEKTGQVKIIWLKDDPAKLPYIVTKIWLDQQTSK